MPLTAFRLLFWAILWAIALPSNAQEMSFRQGDTLFVAPNDTFSVDFRIHPFEGLLAWQVQLNWDSNALRFLDVPFQFQGVQPNLSAGKLLAAWVSPVEVSLPDTATLLRLRFRASAQHPVHTLLYMDTLGLRPEAYCLENGSIVSKHVALRPLVVVVRQCSVAIDLPQRLPLCLDSVVVLKPTCVGCFEIRWQDGVSSSQRLATSPGWYHAWAKAPLQCIASDSIELVEAAPPALSLPPTLHLCPNTAIYLRSNILPLDHIYRWSTGSTSAAIEVAQAGTYHLSVTNAEGCKAVASTTVTYGGPTHAVLDVQQPNCQRPQGSVTFDKVEGGLLPYLYAANDGVWGQSKRFYLEAGRPHRMAIQDANGCEWQDTVVLQPAYRPAIAIYPKAAELMAGDSVLLTASIPSIYPNNLVNRIGWMPSEGLSTNPATPEQVWAKPTRPTTYTATIWSTDGCVASDSAQIRFKQTGYWHFFAPNAIAPESQHDNQFFSLNIYDARISSVTRLSIYDRWGTLVFESRTQNPTWEGQSSQGVAVPAGVFTWIGELTLVNGVITTVAGELMVLR